MKCIKTGAIVYLDQYGASVHCDAFDNNGQLVLRTAAKLEYDPLPIYHFRVFEILAWFDQDKNYGTLFAGEHEAFGYEGKPASEVLT